MKDSAERYWNPSPGESVTGTVIETDIRQTEFIPDVRVFILDVGEDSPLAVYAMSRSLEVEFSTLAPEAGDRITVRRAENSPRRTYKRFRVDMAGGANV